MNVRCALLVNKKQPDFIHCKIHFRQLVIYETVIYEIDIKKYKKIKITLCICFPYKKNTYFNN